MIETAPNLPVEDQEECHQVVSGALNRFLAFHRRSIEDAAKEEEEKEESRRRRSRQNIRSPQSSQQSLASPPSTQQSTSRSPTPPGTQPKQHERDAAAFCARFAGTSLYQPLVDLWTHVCKHQTGDHKERHKVSLPHLGKSLESIRTQIQEMATNQKQADQLRAYYGDNHFKCQRVVCDYFHEGFGDKTALKNHSDRHDRPYECPVKGCSSAAFGFSTNKDRDRHIRFYHPDESGQPAKFNLELTEGNSRQMVEARWECEICHKRFTRQSIKKDHVDAHYGERRHACETCGKRFTRSNDRNRHRRTHVRRARV